MNSHNFKLSERIIPQSYVNQAHQARQARENEVKILLEHRKLPERGWAEEAIEHLLHELSAMDSNNFPGNCGVGEREARVVSGLVARRHFRLCHGIGRSGDITAVQPKAAGSSILMKLTNSMLLDIIRISGAPSTKSCFIVPIATGMALVLCLLALKQIRKQANIVLWPRIDQKTCLKASVAAGLDVVVVENRVEGDELRTDIEALEKEIIARGAENIVCIMSTNCCFAPRAPDRLEEIGKLCKQYDIPHLVNNAYGLQASKCMHGIQQAYKSGRVDAFVQSTDKNLMVPVGGAIVAGFDKQLVDKIAKLYPGRGSGAPTLDVFITLLTLGERGYRKLLTQRKDMYIYLRDEMKKLADKYGERVLETPNNPVCLAMTISKRTKRDEDSAAEKVEDEGSEVTDQSSEVVEKVLEVKNDDDGLEFTELGSMLFTRFVSGTRVVGKGQTTAVSGYSFENYGAHCNYYHSAYLTAAAAIGQTREDVDTFIRRLDKILTKWKKERTPQIDDKITIVKIEDICGSHDLQTLNGETNAQNDAETS